MIHITLLNCFILLPILYVFGTDYCAYHANHFLCEAKQGFAEYCPANTTILKMTDVERNIILDALNLIRSNVARGKSRKDNLLPEASNMLQMEWDTELERAATNIAKRCGANQLHFPFCCKCNIFDRFETNLVQHICREITDYDNPDWAFYFEFFSSKKNFALSEIDNVTTDFLLRDNYDLLIRAELYLVGCSATRYTKKNQKIHFPVCVFGSISGWKGKPIYLKGKMATNCPAGSTPSTTKKGLCKCNGKCYITDPKRNVGNSGNDAAVLTSVTGDTKPPTNYCTKNKRHMLCTNDTYYTKATCKRNNEKRYPYGNIDRRDYVKVLNDFRDELSSGKMIWGKPKVKVPPASNMLQLEWDEELERAATNLIETCEIQYFDFCCECHKFNRFDVNLYQIIIPNSTYISDYRPAWNHYANLVGGKMKSFGMSERYNYTRNYFSSDRFYLLARADINFVGCSTSIFKEGSEKLYSHHAVCVFGGISGWKGTTQYLEGKSCTKCPTGSSCSTEYGHLCKCNNICYTAGGLNSFTWFSAANVPVSKIQSLAITGMTDQNENIKLPNLLDVQTGDDIFPVLNFDDSGSHKLNTDLDKDKDSQGHSDSSDAQILTSFYNFCVPLLWIILNEFVLNNLK